MAGRDGIAELEADRIAINVSGTKRAGLLPDDGENVRIEIAGPGKSHWMHWYVWHGQRIVASGDVWSGHRKGPWEECFRQANRMLSAYVLGPWPPEG